MWGPVRTVTGTHELDENTERGRDSDGYGRYFPCGTEQRVYVTRASPGQRWSRRERRANRNGWLKWRRGSSECDGFD